MTIASELSSLDLLTPFSNQIATIICLDFGHIMVPVPCIEFNQSINQILFQTEKLSSLV